MPAHERLTEELATTSTTRRKIVTTGVKLGYALPAVAATYTLMSNGALAACGGETPLAITAGGDNLCCGCCAQGGAGGDQTILEALQACQAALAAAGTDCPLPGETGSDVQRVCITLNVS